MKRFTATLDPALPLLAIDLGYSNRSRSCGLFHAAAPEAVSLPFGDCIRWTVDHLRTHGPHTLILEAVLSTYHNSHGNPEIRGEFEKGRGWYHGPGVSTFAAAIRFLAELDRMLPAKIRPIPLVEGFLSYKPERTQHSDDAVRLLTEFATAERFHPVEGSEPAHPEILGPPEIRRYNRPNTKETVAIPHTS